MCLLVYENMSLLRQELYLQVTNGNLENQGPSTLHIAVEVISNIDTPTHIVFIALMPYSWALSKCVIFVIWSKRFLFAVPLSSEQVPHNSQVHGNINTSLIGIKSFVTERALGTLSTEVL